MKIGISTACFYPRPLEDSFARIAALGLDTIEIFFNTDSEFLPPFSNLIQSLLKENQLDLVSVHPYTSIMEGILLFSEYARRTEDGFGQYQRYFATARKLGARYLTLHGERQMPGVQDSPAAVERKLERYHRLCQLATQEGMIVAQENVAWCKSQNPLYLKLLYDNIPELRYTLDIKQAHRAGHHWREYFDIVAPRLVNVHINDFDETHSCLLPGEGTLDYHNLFSTLRASGYDNQVLIEVYAANFTDDQQVNNAAAFLRHAAQQAGYSID